MTILILSLVLFSGYCTIKLNAVHICSSTCQFISIIHIIVSLNVVITKTMLQCVNDDHLSIHCWLGMESYFQQYSNE